MLGGSVDQLVDTVAHLRDPRFDMRDLSNDRLRRGVNRPGLLGRVWPVRTERHRGVGCWRVVFRRPPDGTVESDLVVE